MITVEDLKRDPKLIANAMADAYFYGKYFCGYDLFTEEPHHRWFYELGASPIGFNEDGTLKYKQLPTYSLWQNPRGTLKTSARVLTLVPWLLLHDPSLRIAVVRATMSKAQEAVMAIQKNLTNALHKAVFKDLKSSIWSESGLKFNMRDRPDDGRIDPNCTALGSGSEATGSHYDWIIVDDLVGPGDRDSMALRESNCRYLSDIVSYLDISANPNCHLVTVGTPWHPDDAYAHIERRAKDKREFSSSDDNNSSMYTWWIHKEGALKEDGSLRYPELLSHEKLRMLEYEKGPVEFASQYLLTYLSSSTSPFRPEIFHHYTNNFFPNYFVIYVDPSMGTSSESDFSCIVAMGVREDSLGPIGALWEIDMKIRPPSEIMDSLRMWYQSLSRIAPVRLMGMESVGFQALIPDIPSGDNEGYLDFGRELKVHKVKIPGNIAKRARILGLDGPIVNGRILFPKFWESNQRWAEAMRQLLSYTLGGTTLHDDFPDALAGAWGLINNQELNRGGMTMGRKKINAEDLASGELTYQDLVDSGVTPGYIETLRETGVWIPKREESGAYQLSDVFGGIKVSPTLGTPLRIKNE